MGNTVFSLSEAGCKLLWFVSGAGGNQMPLFDSKGIELHFRSPIDRLAHWTLYVFTPRACCATDSVVQIF